MITALYVKLPRNPARNIFQDSKSILNNLLGSFLGKEEKKEDKKGLQEAELHLHSIR